MVSLKGCHFLKDVVLYAVFFYSRYTVSYRDLDEIMSERGVHDVRIRPSSEKAMIGEDSYAQLELTVKVAADSTKSATYALGYLSELARLELKLKGPRVGP